MVTQVVWGTLAKVTGGLSGTAPEMFVGSTDQLESVIITAGAIAIGKNTSLGGNSHLCIGNGAA